MSKICTFLHGGQERLGFVVGDKVVDYQSAATAAGLEAIDSVVAFLKKGDAALAALKTLEASADLSASYAYGEKDVTLLAPVPKPGKFLCLAANFRSHILEFSDDGSKPYDIHVFTKSNTSVAAPNTELVFNQNIKHLDYELELGVVIGKSGRYIPREKASEHVAGYVVANDLGDRQFMPQLSQKPIHWFAMKGQDDAAPYGPYLLLKDGVDADALEITLWLNGEIMQQAVACPDMTWGIEESIARLSEWVTLEAGDVIIFGTPKGNGWGRQVFLKDGDVVKVALSDNGSFSNTIRFEKPVYRAW